MLAKIIILISLLQITVLAEEKPFLDLKKVIRGALDVVAAVPTSPTANYDFGDASKLTAPNGIQGIDPVFSEKLSRLFHIPPDFVHRLAAQAGFIDYEPTTAKPFSNYWFKSKPHVPYVSPEYSTGSAFIQEDPLIASNSANDLSAIAPQQGQQASILQSQQQAIIFQPVIKDGHLYYQPFGVLPQGGQPKMIIYGGRLYMATPLQSGTHSQVSLHRTIYFPIFFLSKVNIFYFHHNTINIKEVTEGDGTAMQNSREMSDKNKKDEKASNVSNESNEEMHYHRIYAQHMKAVEDAQIQANKLQQVIAPDTSSIKILGIESKARTSSPYRKVYKKEYEIYDAPHQFNLKEKPEEVNTNLTQGNMSENGKPKVMNIEVTTSVVPHKQPVETVKDFATETEISNSPFYQLSFNESFKQSEKTDNIATDRIVIEENEEQTVITTSTQQTAKFLTETLSPEKISFNENTEFMGKNQKMHRILALRRKMAADRKKFAERKRLLSSMKRKVNKEEDMDREIFRRHCSNIRSLAQQFGFNSVKQYVMSNCVFIENYYPEFKCEEAEDSVEKCERLS
uniref:BZIP domain-containing protein n=1 Tax=Elaeophora elaphi TaxID=1147741 RepID=A0A0R3S6C1_9BILA